MYGNQPSSGESAPEWDAFFNFVYPCGRTWPIHHPFGLSSLWNANCGLVMTEQLSNLTHFPNLLSNSQSDHSLSKRFCNLQRITFENMSFLTDFLLKVMWEKWSAKPAEVSDKNESRW